MTADRRVARFHSFLLTNKTRGVTECIAIGVTRFRLKPNEAQSLVRAWLLDGSLVSLDTGKSDEPGKRGRRKTIVTAPQRTASK